MSEPQAPPTTSGPAARPWWRDHLGWLLGGVPVALALVRVAVASRFDPQTAGVIVSKSGTLAILSVVFFVTAPLWLVLGIAVVWHRFRFDPSISTRFVHVVAAVTAVYLVIKVPVMRLQYVALGLVLAGFVIWLETGRARRGQPVHFPLVAALLFLLSLGYLLSTDVIWLPPEVVRHDADGAGGQAAERVVGYVLGEDRGWLTVLREADRGVTMLRSDSVTERAVCRLGDPRTRSLFDLIVGRPAVNYPPCPSLAAPS